MVWFIIIAVICGIVLYFYFQNRRSYPKTMHQEENILTANADTSTADNTIDSIDEQLFSQNIARYCGAIKAIRTMNNWRDEFQHAMFSVQFNDDGLISISASYEHSSDFNVYSALMNGGYLQYAGFAYRKDGFNYDIEFHDKYQESNGLEYIQENVSEAAVKSYIYNYFDGNVSYTSCWTKENVVYVSFTIND